MILRWVIIVVGATMVLMPNRALALSIAPRLETVPIDRVVANLERQYDHPDPNVNNTANIAERLARLHAFAYAQKTDSVEVEQNIHMEWYGDAASPGQFRMVKPGSDSVRNRAQQHLDAAILWYERALDLSPTDRVAQLGYGWTLMQAGRRDEAKQVYRKIIAHEMRMTGDVLYDLGHGNEIRSKWITAEALDYLIPLLHPLWDWRELRVRREQRKTIENWGDGISPIVVPLDASVSLQDILRDDLDVAFNLDGSGPDQRWTWISPRAGWLVCDYDDKGLITSGRKLVGNVTFWVFWNNGFEVLAALDDNADGALAGEELHGLKIWRDADCDGICRPEELMTLESCGIAALSTNCNEVECAGRTMWASPNGITFADGSKRSYYDVVLRRQLSNHEFASAQH
jgi:tetratricopeptide (TPR) repeat protein